MAMSLNSARTAKVLTLMLTLAGLLSCASAAETDTRPTCASQEALIEVFASGSDYGWASFTRSDLEPTGRLSSAKLAKRKWRSDDAEVRIGEEVFAATLLTFSEMDGASETCGLTMGFIHESARYAGRLYYLTLRAVFNDSGGAREFAESVQRHLLKRHSQDPGLQDLGTPAVGEFEWSDHWSEAADVVVANSSISALDSGGVGTRGFRYVFSLSVGFDGASLLK